MSLTAFPKLLPENLELLTPLLCADAFLDLFRLDFETPMVTLQVRVHAGSCSRWILVRLVFSGVTSIRVMWMDAGVVRLAQRAREVLDGDHRVQVQAVVPKGLA